MVHKNLKSTVGSLRLECSVFPDNLILIDQSHHLNLKEGKKEKPEFVRDLTKVINYLKSVTIKSKRLDKFDEVSILFLESEPEKVNDTVANSIPMNLFTEAYLRYPEAEKIKFEQEQDKLLDYLENLLDTCVDDIREYLKNNKISADSSENK